MTMKFSKGDLVKLAFDHSTRSEPAVILECNEQMLTYRIGYLDGSTVSFWVRENEIKTAKEDQKE